MSERLTQSEFDRWVERHGPIFMMTSEADVRTFAAWFDLFASCGYRASDLNAATDAMAKIPPADKWGQLEAIHRHARRAGELRRHAERLQVGDTKPDRGVCVLCREFGYVLVPHPLHIDPKSPLGFTAISRAICWCEKGRWTENDERRKAGDRPFCITLTELNTKVPNWRDLMLAYEDFIAADQKAASAIADDDRTDKAMLLTRSIDKVRALAKAEHAATWERMKQTELVGA